MVQCSDGASLTLESLAELTSGDFDRDVALHNRVSGSAHFSHAVSAPKGKNFVWSEFVACGKQHVRNLAKFIRSENGKRLYHGQTVHYPA
jgi:hypothetical protein